MLENFLRVPCYLDLSISQFIFVSYHLFMIILNLKRTIFSTAFSGNGDR